MAEIEKELEGEAGGSDERAEDEQEGGDPSGEEVLSGEVEDDDPDQGKASGRAGSGEEDDGDDEEEVVDPAPKRPAGRAVQATGDRRNTEPVPDELQPMRASYEEKSGVVSRFRAFMKGETKLRDGRSFADLDPNVEQTEYRVAYEDALREERAARREYESAKKQHDETQSLVRGLSTFGQMAEPMLKASGLKGDARHGAVGYLHAAYSDGDPDGFFDMPREQQTEFLRKRFGGGAAASGTKKRNEAVLLPKKKAPPPIASGRTSGGSPSSQASPVKGLSVAEADYLKRNNPRLYASAQSGKVDVREVKSIVAELMPRKG